MANQETPELELVQRCAMCGHEARVALDDITDPKHAEATLRASGQRQAFLLRLSDALRAEADADAVANRAIGMLFEQLRLDRCYVAVYRLADDRADFTHQVGNDRLPRLPDGIRLSDFPNALQIACGGTLVIDDVAVTEGLSETDRHNMAALGMGALVAASLRNGQNRPFWVIVAVSASSRRWAPHEIALVEEVTERTWAAMERVRAEQVLHETDRRKNEFLATLAHELRNPLAPIRNGLHLMKLAGGDARLVEKWRVLMERQVEQMVHLIDDLMDVSRVSRGKIALVKTRLPLALAVEAALDSARHLIEERGHELVVSVPPEPIDVDADRIRLAQVFGNLLNNAAKYTERGGRIRIAVERQGSDAVVVVEDNGVGIPAHMLDKVFDMFAQVDRSLEKSQGGLGIGLNIVKGLVEMHDGSVAAESRGPGAGSRFVVRLPVAQSGSSVEKDDRDAAPVSRPHRRRILVVDDNEDAAESLANLLDFLGNETQVAHDGLEAIAVAEVFRPDLILMDIGMPLLNGYDACRRIREQPWGHDTVIVAQSGWGQDSDKRKSKEAGFDLLLVKPVDVAVLEKLLAEAPVTGAGRQ